MAGDRCGVWEERKEVMVEESEAAWEEIKERKKTVETVNLAVEVAVLEVHHLPKAVAADLVAVVGAVPAGGAYLAPAELVEREVLVAVLAHRVGWGLGKGMAGEGQV